MQNLTKAEKEVYRVLSLAKRPMIGSITVGRLNWYLDASNPSAAAKTMGYVIRELVRKGLISINEGSERRMTFGGHYGKAWPVTIHEVPDLFQATTFQAPGAIQQQAWPEVANYHPACPICDVVLNKTLGVDDDWVCRSCSLTFSKDLNVIPPQSLCGARCNDPEHSNTGSGGFWVCFTCLLPDMHASVNEHARKIHWCGCVFIEAS